MSIKIDFVQFFVVIVTMGISSTGDSSQFIVVLSRVLFILLIFYLFFTYFSSLGSSCITCKYFPDIQISGNFPEQFNIPLLNDSNNNNKILLVSLVGYFIRM